MFKKRIKSFGYAFQGLLTLIKDEPNGRIHSIAAITAILLGFYFNISRIEWMFVLLAIGFVITAELFNSAIENLADLISSEFHPLIKKAKDLSAAGVFICAIISFLIGLIVFIPKFV